MCHIVKDNYTYPSAQGVQGSQSQSVCIHEAYTQWVCTTFWNWDHRHTLSEAKTMFLIRKGHRRKGPHSTHPGVVMKRKIGFKWDHVVCSTNAVSSKMEKTNSPCCVWLQNLFCWFNFWKWVTKLIRKKKSVPRNVKWWRLSPLRTLAMKIKIYDRLFFFFFFFSLKPIYPKRFNWLHLCIKNPPQNYLQYSFFFIYFVLWWVPETIVIIII